jgi:DNA segregation ATPase FtsK/SpoIIIE, S-DNA-T family
MLRTSFGKSRRSAGAEFRAVVWMVRHPGSVAAPAALVESLNYLGPTLTSTVLGAAGTGMAGWYRGHPDTFDTVAAPVLRAWHRRWLGAYRGRRWSDLMAVCELTKTHPRTLRTMVPRVIRVRSWSASVDTVRVKLVPGQSPRAWTNQLENIASTLKAERVALDVSKPGEIVLIVQRDEPFTYVIPSPDMPETVEEVDLSALVIGEDELGRDWTQPLLGGHTVTSGATGAGKNSIVLAKMRAAMPMIRAGLVRPWIVDPKLVEFITLQPMLGGRYASDPQDGADLVRAFVDNMERKQKRMQRNKLRSAPVSEEYPLDWLILDEIGSLLAYRPEHAHQLVSDCSLITSLGRSTHDVLECMIQEPTKDVLPIRDLIPRRVCLRATSERHPDMVLGDGMREKGAIADQLPEEGTAGIGWAIAPKVRLPKRIRSAYTSDTDMTDLVSAVKAGTGLRVVA